jgi:hypothetical protein
MSAVTNVVRSMMDSDPVLDGWLQEQTLRYQRIGKDT